MVVESREKYDELTYEVELKLDEADRAADASDERYTAEEVFRRVRERLHGREAV